MRILMTRASSIVCYDALDSGSTQGEGGEAMGCILWLLDQGHDVTYYGRVRGTLPEGVHHVVPSRVPFDRADGKTQWDTLGKDMEEVAKFDPEILLQWCHSKVSFTTFDNPKGNSIIPLAYETFFSIFPAYSLDIPRICLVNDPRCLPGEFDWTDEYPEVAPQAILSQRESVINKTINGRKVRLTETYAGIETWMFYKRPIPDPPAKRDIPVVVVAHCHATDSMQTPWKKTTWPRLLTGQEVIHGVGWEDIGVQAEPISIPEVIPLLQRSVCGPILPPAPGFLSSKIVQYVKAGCCPLLYHGQYPYDDRAEYVPLDSPLRFRTPQEYKNLVQRFTGRPEEAAMYCSKIHVDPWFGALQRVLDGERSPVWVS